MTPHYTLIRREFVGVKGHRHIAVCVPCGIHRDFPASEAGRQQAAHWLADHEEGR